MPKSDFKKKMLWIDDDDQERFQFEEAVLQEEDHWAISWAASVEKATALLSQDSFDAILLDQTLPSRDGHESVAQIWTGCRLLYWLRQKELSFGENQQEPNLEPWDFIKDLKPLPKNSRIPVLVISAAFDPVIFSFMEKAIWNIPFISKPIDLDKLRSILERVVHEGRNT